MIYLQSYNKKDFGLGYFTDGRIIYELHVKVKSFFGLVVKDKIIDYTIHFDDNITAHFEHWDNLIKTQNPIK